MDITQKKVALLVLKHGIGFDLTASGFGKDILCRKQYNGKFRRLVHCLFHLAHFPIHAMAISA